MASNSMITVYLGAGEQGFKLYQQLMKTAEKADKSVSEFVKDLIVKGLK